MWLCGSQRRNPVCYACHVRQIHKKAWLLVLLSAGLQIVIFPLPNQYMLCWVAIAPLFVALQRARVPNTLQVSEGVKLYPASPGQAFLLAYVCGILWYAGTCYWIYNTMRQYGGVSAPLGVVFLVLFSLYLALCHRAFGLLISLVTGRTSLSRRALLLGPVGWVAVELGLAGISGFPRGFFGVTQAD